MAGELDCERCYFNRPLTAWGTTFMACYYSMEKGKELYSNSVDNTCSGFKEAPADEK